MLNRRTERIEILAPETFALAPAPDRFPFDGGRFSIRIANDIGSRRKAYGLVYDLYIEKDYAQPRRSRMWVSDFDALPGTTTLLAERSADGAAVGSLTVVADSPAGLPADKIYRDELDALRSGGRRLAEVMSLGVAGEARAGSPILARLFNFAYLVARGIHGATDFVVTVNPRHVRFYERLMLFAPAGPERAYAKVGGAPAVLLRLDFDEAERQRGLARLGATSRSIYGQFRAVREEPETVAALSDQLRPMTGEELEYFFAARTDILAGATPEQRAHVEARRRGSAVGVG